MSDFDITDSFRKIFLAGVGAAAMTAEKSQEVVTEFVKKGELTVEQGKALNEELSRKAKEVIDGSSDDALKASHSRGACRLRRQGRQDGCRHRGRDRRGRGRGPD